MSSRSFGVHGRECSIWASGVSAPEEAAPRVRTASGATTSSGRFGGCSDGETPPRYETLELLATGGMGEIRRAWDTVLGRAVAMKLLAWSLLDSAPARSRFQAETKVTAGLEHPGIVSIYDAGVSASGRPWYTMRLLRGRTLDSAIYQGGRDPRASTSLRSLVRAFGRVCEAMVYAHERSVIHRDLKPQNIMVSPLDEVLILDWGLAKRSSTGLEREPVPLAARADQLDVSLTLAGDVLGTPGYMAPEQARGELASVGTWSDVYALGAILHEVLFRARPAGGSYGASELSEPSARPLLDVCERCLALEPSRRPDVGTLAGEIESWLGAERRREQARKMVSGVTPLEHEVTALKAHASELRSQARRLLSELHSYSSVLDKEQAWQLEGRAEEIERSVGFKEGSWLEGLHAALALDPSCPEAHAPLARHHAQALLDAEARRDARAIAMNETLLAEHDRGDYRPLLGGAGRLTLATDPDGATVEVFRYVERLRRLELVPHQSLGPTPLVECALPAGSYLLVLRAPGCIDVRYPVYLERGGSWHGSPPGGRATPVRLPRIEALSSDAVYVPAGWFSSGGDERAVESLPARRVWVDGFAIQRHPVDNRSYLEFLNGCVARGDLDLALRCAPRMHRGSGGGVKEPLVYTLSADGEFRLAPPSEATPWELDGPVALIDWHSAAAYAAWLEARSGRPWRLPNELEWEKAARGVDGRVVAFGDHVEPTRACMLGSHPGVPRPLSVHAYAEDESPYGVRGMTGNVRDWCENDWHWDGPSRANDRLQRGRPATDSGPRAVRGGAWSAMPDFCRACGRFALSPGERLLAVGFRLAYSLE
jgi:eukaryotic-like serine/threonine-protein kinase